MTRIELKRLTMQNFKGARDRVIEFAGDTNIRGANGTGKSTVYDAFTWLLFDKNSSDSKDFAIKPRQKNGEETHYLDIRVEGIFDVDRDGDVEELRLEKIYRENWVKKRGEAEQEYSGNTTDHAINGVPVKAGEYKSYINLLLQEDRFKLLTSAVYFNSVMSWKERRELLFELAGMGDESEIIGSYDKGELIVELLNGKKIDDVLKMHASTLKRLNAEIEKIPIRIDEAALSVPVVDAQAIVAAQSDNADIENQVREIERELLEKSKIGVEVDGKYRDLSALKSKYMIRKAQLEHSDADDKAAIKEYQTTLERETSREKRLRSDADLAEKNIELHEQRLAKLREQYKLESEKTQAIDMTELVCETCGQSLPAGQKEEMLAKLHNDFAVKKAKTLEQINNEGKLIARQKDNAVQEAGGIQKRLEAAELDIKLIETKISDIVEKMFDTVKPDISTDSELTELTAKMNTLQSEIDNYHNTAGDDLINRKSALTAKITANNEIIARQKQFDEAQSRIEVLSASEREYAEHIATVQDIVYELEQYVIYKCEYISDRINACFDRAKFILFTQQINGGVTECCECMIDGTPYADANDAAKINTGLEIIDRLCEHYGFHAPIFIDKAESVNELYKTSAQQIKLTVTGDANLAVVTEVSDERIRYIREPHKMAVGV